MKKNNYEKNNAKVCDVYIRKSNDRDDKQVQSLENQKRVTEEIRKKYGLTVKEVFYETKSAHKPYNRPNFDTMIERIKEGVIGGIICWDLNRLSRNPLESGIIHQLMEDGKLKTIYTDNYVYSDEDDLVMDIKASMNSRYSKDLKKSVLLGMDTKVKNGIFPGAAPLGYLNYINDRREKTIIRDPENWPKVRKLWDYMLTGAYNMPRIYTEAQKMNIKFKVGQHQYGKMPSLSTIRGIFRNPFYCGYMRWRGEVVPAKHEPMVTKEEWDKVQEMLSCDQSRNTRPKKHSSEHKFGGMLRCGDCGYSIVTEIKHKTLADGSKKEYVLCRCSGKRPNYDCSWHGYVHEEELSEQIKNKLLEYTINPVIYDVALEALNLEEEKSPNRELLRSIDEDIKKIEENRDFIMTKYIEGIIRDDDYKKRDEGFLEQLENLKASRKKIDNPSVDWRELAEESFSFARYAAEDFDNDSVENRKIITQILGGKLSVSPVDRTISFFPVKWLEPIKKAASLDNTDKELVRTDLQQRKNSPLGTVSSKWCT